MDYLGERKEKIKKKSNKIIFLNLSLLQFSQKHFL